MGEAARGENIFNKGIYGQIKAVQLMPHIPLPGLSALKTLYFSAATAAVVAGIESFPERYGQAGQAVGAFLGFLAGLLPLLLVAAFNGRAAWRTLSFLVLWLAILGTAWAIDHDGFLAIANCTGLILVGAWIGVPVLLVIFDIAILIRERKP